MKKKHIFKASIIYEQQRIICIFDRLASKKCRSHRRQDCSVHFLKSPTSYTLPLRACSLTILEIFRQCWLTNHSVITCLLQMMPEWIVTQHGRKIWGALKLETPNENIYNAGLMNRTVLQSRWIAFVDIDDCPFFTSNLEGWLIRHVG
jgi:hypothetical protein